MRANGKGGWVMGFAAVMCCFLTSCAAGQGEQIIGELGGQGVAVAAPVEGGKWGIEVRGAGLASMRQERPAFIEVFRSEGQFDYLFASYDSVERRGDGLVGRADMEVMDGVRALVEDRWTVRGQVLAVERKVEVKGSAEAGFLSGVLLTTAADVSRGEMGYFAPGVMYGSTENLTVSAIGGEETFSKGGGHVWIREDRLPAPLLGLRFKDGRSVAILNPRPDGRTTLADAHDVDAAEVLTDEGFRFGALGAGPADGKLRCGYLYPGTEGEVTYKANTYPRGQMNKWRRRYHPLKDGLVQEYRVELRFGAEETFPAFFKEAWRWAWGTLRPEVVVQDIETARQCLAKMLADETETVDGRTLITNYVTCSPSEEYRRAVKAVMGFTGKNLETAEYLLRNSYVAGNPDAQRQRRLGRAIIDTFTTLKMNAPEGEGFIIATGEPAVAGPSRGDRFALHLRSFGDGMKVATKAYLLEKEQGTDHERWLAWLVEFGDWLMSKQGADGSFPRTYVVGTGEAKDMSPNCTYEAVPFLVLLSKASGDKKYFEAALRAGEFAWKNGQDEGVFVGGTIDNPNVIDKEAGTLSLEAYVTLYEATGEARWLEAAKAAADFSETWVYIWNVPMVEEDDDSKLHWKKGVPTVGVQLISTGHSLVDAYMGFDADEYAKLWKWTGDRHYYEVAGILLHNTKVMMALPDRPYDLNGPGWLQEHWSLAPLRGYGLHRGWLPWVSCAQLNGIFGIRDFDEALFKELSAGGRQ